MMSDTERSCAWQATPLRRGVRWRYHSPSRPQFLPSSVQACVRDHKTRFAVRAGRRRGCRSRRGPTRRTASRGRAQRAADTAARGRQSASAGRKVPRPPLIAAMAWPGRGAPSVQRATAIEDTPWAASVIAAARAGVSEGIIRGQISRRVVIPARRSIRDGSLFRDGHGAPRERTLRGSVCGTATAGATPAPSLYPVPSPVAPPTRRAPRRMPVAPPDSPMPAAPHSCIRETALAGLAWAVGEETVTIQGIRRLSRPAPSLIRMTPRRDAGTVCPADPPGRRGARRASPAGTNGRPYPPDTVRDCGDTGLVTRGHDFRYTYG